MALRTKPFIKKQKSVQKILMGTTLEGSQSLCSRSLLLAQAGFWSLAVDMKGYGESSAPPGRLAAFTAFPVGHALGPCQASDHLPEV